MGVNPTRYDLDEYDWGKSFACCCEGKQNMSPWDGINKEELQTILGGWYGGQWCPLYAISSSIYAGQAEKVLTRSHILDGIATIQEKLLSYKTLTEDDRRELTWAQKELERLVDRMPEVG
jgi:hypothetical protein